MNRTKVYVETIGCQMNVADTERAESRLRSAGYELTSLTAEADVVLINSCSVRERAEQKVFNRIGEIRHESDKRTVFGVLGCVAQLEGPTLFKRSKAIGLVAGPRAIERLPALIERATNGEDCVVDIGDHSEADPWEVVPGMRHSRHVAFVPIIEGCNKFCTYCIVPYSRGRELSRRASDILSEVKRLQRDGFQEIQLLGQNVNSYRPKTDEGLRGFDGATPFSRLLRAVASTGLPRIKFTTSFPRDFHPDIVAAIDENENLCNWVHLPVQSGSDRILKLMRRGYKVADYLRRVEAIKAARRPIALTTDIIVGFPGETRADFDETMALIERCQFDGIYIFKYSARHGTPAHKMDDDVSKEEKKERFLRLELLQKNIQGKIYARYIGQRVKVLVEGHSSRSVVDLSGHSTCNKIVNFEADPSLLGSILDVRITEAKSNSLFGTVR